MTEPIVRYELRQPAAILTLNRPDKRNAISRGLVTALTEAVTRARDDVSVRCMILTGAGTSFCAGMDLAELSESIQQSTDAHNIWHDALSLANLYDLIYTLPKPTIAAVNGPAVAGGAGFVTVCDMALAVPEAKFGYPEVRRGLVAAMVMPHLLRHVSERMARYLLLTGELIDAVEAHRCCLINAVVEQDKLLDHALAWGRSVAEGGPNALLRTKNLLHQFSKQALSIEQAAQASAGPRLTEECKQGLEAFFAKKPAPWVSA